MRKLLALTMTVLGVLCVMAACGEESPARRESVGTAIAGNATVVTVNGFFWSRPQLSSMSEALIADITIENRGTQRLSVEKEDFVLVCGGERAVAKATTFENLFGYAEGGETLRGLASFAVEKQSVGEAVLSIAFDGISCEVAQSLDDVRLAAGAPLVKAEIGEELHIDQLMITVTSARGSAGKLAVACDVRSVSAGAPSVIRSSDFLLWTSDYASVLSPVEFDFPESLPTNESASGTMTFETSETGGFVLGMGRQTKGEDWGAVRLP